MSADRFEREADRAADDAMRPEGASTFASPLRHVNGAAGLAEAPTIAQHALDTPGFALDSATRDYFEPRFGHDFSRVRVHAGSDANEAARAAGAHAYTVGHHIVFASGRFSPSTRSGRQLIAHELAHVVQQSGGAPGLQCKDAAAPMRYDPSMPMDQALKELPNMARPDALEVLKRYQSYILQSIKAGEGRIRAQMELRAEGFGNYVIGGTIEFFGGATLPSDDWNDAWQGLIASYDTIRAGQVKESLEKLNAASRATAKHWEELNEYFDRTDVGVDKSVTYLKAIVILAAAVEAVLLAWAAAPALKALALSGALATSPVAAPVATTAAPIVIAETAAVAAPTIAAAAPTVAAAAAPTVAAAAGPTVAAAAPAVATAVTAPAASSTLTTLAVGTTLVAATTISSDTPPPQKEEEKKKRPPFVLRLPRQKAAHFAHYRSMLGVLQSDPFYERGNPGQRDIWNRSLRLGGGEYAIDYEVYERGHALGLQGEDGEERIRIPDWSRRRGPPGAAMEVDHIIELQVAPAALRFQYNSMENFELLERDANGESGRLLQANIAEERAKQVAFDPSAASRVLVFDDVVLDGGTSDPERWTLDEIRAGEQLDVYEENYYVP